MKYHEIWILCNTFINWSWTIDHIICIMHDLNIYKKFSLNGNYCIMIHLLPEITQICKYLDKLLWNMNIMYHMHQSMMKNQSYQKHNDTWFEYIQAIFIILVIISIVLWYNIPLEITQICKYLDNILWNMNIIYHMHQSMMKNQSYQTYNNVYTSNIHNFGNYCIMIYSSWSNSNM